MPSNNVFQYTKIQTPNKVRRKALKPEKKNGIQLFLESGIHCAGIQNPRLSWIPLHGAILGTISSPGRFSLALEKAYWGRGCTRNVASFQIGFLSSILWSQCNAQMKISFPGLISAQCK